RRKNPKDSVQRTLGVLGRRGRAATWRFKKLRWPRRSPSDRRERLVRDVEGRAVFLVEHVGLVAHAGEHVEGVVERRVLLALVEGVILVALRELRLRLERDARTVEE